MLNGVKLGADFLANHQHEIVDDPFAKAIVTYALFVTGKSFVTQKAIRQLRDMRRTSMVINIKQLTLYEKCTVALPVKITNRTPIVNETYETL